MTMEYYGSRFFDKEFGWVLGRILLATLLIYSLSLSLLLCCTLLQPNWTLKYSNGAEPAQLMQKLWKTNASQRKQVRWMYGLCIEKSHVNALTCSAQVGLQLVMIRSASQTYPAMYMLPRPAKAAMNRSYCMSQLWKSQTPQTMLLMTIVCLGKMNAFKAFRDVPS